MEKYKEIKSIYKYWYHRQMSILYLGTTLDEAEDQLDSFDNKINESFDFYDVMKYMGQASATRDFINENREKN